MKGQTIASAVRFAVAAATFALDALVPQAVRADDWLASLPPCSTQAQGAAPSFELVYPRAGLPALVAAGDVLIARVRLPAPLTPPPGVQQPRALAGWRAELQGHALALWGAAAAEQRHALEPVDVRPDGASTLVYRVSLRVPAWAAPGSYDLALWAPGGEARAPSLVRVLDPGAAPRLAWIDSRERLAQPEVAALPVDAWVIDRDRTGQGERAPVDAAAAPLLELLAPALALRVGGALWVLGGCGDEQGAFAQETRSVLVGEQRVRTDPRPAVGPAQWQPLGEAARPWPEPGSVRVTQAALRADVAVGAGFGARAELALLLGRATPRLAQPVSDASFYPAGDIGGAAAGARIVRLQIAAGAQRSLGRALEVPAAAHASTRYVIAAEPQPARSGQPVRLRVRAVDGRAPALRVAWRLDPLHTGFGSGALEHRFVALGEHRIRALVLQADGSAVAAEGRVRVQTARASGCALASRARFAGWLLLWSALLLLKRRLGARAGIDSPAGSVPRGLTS